MTDIISLFNTPGMVLLFLGLLGLVLLLRSPAGQRWTCQRCDDRFESEEEAKGHQAIHAEHKVSQRQ